MRSRDASTSACAGDAVGNICPIPISSNANSGRSVTLCSVSPKWNCLRSPRYSDRRAAGNTATRWNTLFPTANGWHSTSCAAAKRYPTATRPDSTYRERSTRCSTSTGVICRTISPTDFDFLSRTTANAIHSPSTTSGHRTDCCVHWWCASHPQARSWPWWWPEPTIRSRRPHWWMPLPRSSLK